MKFFTTIPEGGVTIIQKPDYEKNIDAQKWHIDYAQLRDVLNQQIDYRTKREEYYSDALIHDVDTIEAVAYERGNSKRCSIFDCKAIFITKNIDICNTIFRLYKNDRMEK